MITDYYWFGPAAVKPEEGRGSMQTVLLNDETEEYVPDDPDPNTVYVLLVGGEPFSVHFYCICGDPECYCAIPVAADLASSWKYTYQNGKVTLEPSLQRRTPCQSHFYLRDGELVPC